MALRLPGSLSARITIGFVVLVTTFASISIYTVLRIDALNRAIRITQASAVKLALISGDLDSKQATLRAYLREELGEERSEHWARKRLQRLIEGRQGLLDTTKEILFRVHAEDDDASRWRSTVDLVERMQTRVDASAAQYQILLDNPPIARRDGAPIDPGRAGILKVQRRQQRAELQIGQLTHDLKTKQTAMVEMVSSGIDDYFRYTWLYALGFGALAVLLGIVMTLGARLMLRPLQRLRDAAGRIARGDYAHRISVDGPSEIADLATEFNVMGQAIQDRSRELVRTERLATAGKMAAMITHEVRNPLSSIGLNTELLEEELAALPPERAEESQSLCRAIVTEIDRLTEITEEYLQLTRLPNPKLQEESLQRVVQSVVDFVRDQMHSRGVAIEITCAGEGTLAIDEGQIRQVVLNLIRNAADAVEGQDDGCIEISVATVEGQTELVISDNGPGIPEELIEQIFEAFVSSKSSGTGLGLALSHQIIGDHGGTIEVNNAPKGGAVFRVKFPHNEP